MSEGKLSRAEAARRHIEDPTAVEHTDASPKGVLIFLAVLLAAILASLALMTWLFGFMGEQRASVEPFPLPKASQLPPRPRIQANPPADLKAYRAREETIMNSYGWVDRSAGVVRIPIGRAIDLLAQRGLPARAAQPPGAAR